MTIKSINDEDGDDAGWHWDWLAKADGNRYRGSFKWLAETRECTSNRNVGVVYVNNRLHFFFCSKLHTLINELLWNASIGQSGHESIPSPIQVLFESGAPTEAFGLYSAMYFGMATCTVYRGNRNLPRTLFCFEKIRDSL